MRYIPYFETAVFNEWQIQLVSQPIYKFLTKQIKKKFQNIQTGWYLRLTFV